VETQTGSDTGSARQATSDVKQAAADQGSQLKETATEHASALAGQAKEQARNVIDDAREELQRQADTQGRRLCQSLGTAGHQLRSMAESGEPGLVTDMVRQIADGFTRVADTVDRGGVQALTEDVRAFARRQPGVFLFGAAAAGFVTARLMRAGATYASTDSDSNRADGTDFTLAESPFLQETAGSPLGSDMGETVGFGSLPTAEVLDQPTDGATTGLTP